jgi:hypothetical protein
MVSKDAMYGMCEMLFLRGFEPGAHARLPAFVLLWAEYLIRGPLNNATAPHLPSHLKAR